MLQGSQPLQLNVMVQHLEHGERASELDELVNHDISWRKKRLGARVVMSLTKLLDSHGAMISPLIWHHWPGMPSADVRTGDESFSPRYEQSEGIMAALGIIER